MAQGNLQAPSTDTAIALLEKVVKVIFSWVVLMPIGVIVSGHLLSQVFHLSQPNPKQFFRIPIPEFLEIRADGDSVILGFSGFLITFLILCTLAGRSIYAVVKTQFGIDPGHFNALCIFSSMATVLWSAVLYLILRSRIKDAQTLAQEHSRLIEQVTFSNKSQNSGNVEGKSP